MNYGFQVKAAQNGIYMMPVVDGKVIEEDSLIQKEVKDFEPLMALDGGDTGLDFYKIISENASAHLKDGGVLLLECGIGQAQEIADMLKGFSSVEIIKDYENIDRIVRAVL